ncbi:hypothetical protein VP249E411_P0245 [Vibrio phage 249E41-1]|nr:hypothetical protein VP249E411_P0245 [Vibrio phage 249E41-1]CAH9017511.1 hypothetical protein VP193E371_P0244 [Vibrio phage 193E37-1]
MTQQTPKQQIKQLQNSIVKHKALFKKIISLEQGEYESDSSFVLRMKQLAKEGGDL